MRTYRCELDAEFNPVVVKKLLLSLRVSPETGERLGVPAARLELWLRELAIRLEDGCRPVVRAIPPAQEPAQTPEEGRLLSPDEIDFLLEGLGDPDQYGRGLLETEEMIPLPGLHANGGP